MKFRGVILLFICIIIGSRAIAQDAHREATSLAEQIAAGWKTIRDNEQYPHGFKVIFKRNSHSRQSKSDEAQEVIYTLYKNGSAQRIESSDSVICVNDKYAFSLRRNTDSKPWKLEELYILDAGTKPTGLLKLLISSNFNLIVSPMTEVNPDISYYDAAMHGRLAFEAAGSESDILREIPYTLSFQHPAADAPLPRDFLIKLEQISAGDRDKILAELKRLHKLTGTMLLDTTHSWRPIRVESRSEGPPFVESSTSFVYGDTDEFSCRSVLFVSKSPQSQLNISIEYTPITNRVDGTDFTLSAYGLPEPVGVEWERPTPWYLYFAAVTALFVTATALFAWLSRRRAAA